MSYGRMPKTEYGRLLLKKSMSKIIKKGTILRDSLFEFEVLNDTTSHGCPDVKITKVLANFKVGEDHFKVGDITPRTLYEHAKDPEYLKSQEEGM